MTGPDFGHAWCNSIPGMGMPNPKSTHNFSTTVKGHDLRATLIERTITLGGGDAMSPHVGPFDPASFADEVMVHLGFDSAYDEDGEWVTGYAEYAETVGLSRKTSAP